MNEPLFIPILPMMKKLGECLQFEFGHILSGTRNMVNHPKPEIRKQIQDKVDAYIQGLLIVYLFALWEEYVDRQLEKDWLPSDKLERLNAFRHIRHSVAHGFDGGRANKLRSEFEAIMNSSQPFPNLTWDSNSLDLTKSQVAYDCQRFMEDAAKSLIGRISNNKKPNEIR